MLIAYMSRSFFERQIHLTMATVEVILKEKIEGLGAEADVVKVKRGYARNFLVPQGCAFEATKGNLRHVAKLKEARARREAEERADAENAATKLKKLRLSTELAIGQGGKAFGSVTSADIAALINEKSKLDIDKNQIDLEKPIKTTGSYDIAIKLHPDVEASVTVRVLAADDKEESSEASED